MNIVVYENFSVTRLIIQNFLNVLIAGGIRRGNLHWLQASLLVIDLVSGVGLIIIRIDKRRLDIVH